MPERCCLLRVALARSRGRQPIAAQPNGFPAHTGGENCRHPFDRVVLGGRLWRRLPHRRSRRLLVLPAVRHRRARPGTCVFRRACLECFFAPRGSVAGQAPRTDQHHGPYSSSVEPVSDRRSSERTFAAGVTNLARNVLWAVGSGVAGLLMQALSFSAPLVLGGGIKILYDLLLYRSFRRLNPPEERVSA